MQPAPIHTGRFFISGSYVIDPAPDEAIVIRMDAGQAFGTGNHETTKGCLQAIDVICDRKLPSNSLDVGTGSGTSHCHCKMWRASGYSQRQ